MGAGGSGLRAVLAAGSGAGAAGVFGRWVLGTPVQNEEKVDPAKYPWSHGGMASSLDHASVRRGYQVYKEICSQCHSLKRIAYRHLVGVSHTLEEAKAEAAEVQIQDGPDENGELFMRPGRISDRMPSPYANEEAARAANGGAVPPDLSLMTKARPDGQNYVFSLLTGYSEPPAGVSVKGNLHYNKYFPGGAIAMARNVYEDVVEYADGTPASAAQIAKDVTTFLAWAAEPEQDERKRTGLKAMALCAALAGLTLYLKRHRFTAVKNAHFVYTPPRKGSARP